MDYKKIYFRAKQFGGFRLAKAYIGLGLGMLVVRNVFMLICGIKSRDDAYSAISRAAYEKLLQKYQDFLHERKAYYDAIEMNHSRSNRVWTSWLQGLDQAPVLVKVCVDSMNKYLTGSEVILLSLEDFNKYVELPTDIVDKFRQGYIPPASFSDLLRLQLLIKYGGTWMDATVLCTGEDEKEILDCDLFVFQTIDEEVDLHGISTWFMTACKNNELLMVLFDVLIQYWRDYDCTVDYYIIHDFFCSIAELYPEKIVKMPRKDRLIPLKLMQRIGDEYDAEWMKELTKKSCFHKLNYRLDSSVLNNSNNFYHAILEEGINN